MTCTLCTWGVRKKVSALLFVQDLSIDLAKALVTITFKQPNQETQESILAPLQLAIKRAGFEFAGIVSVEK